MHTKILQIASVTPGFQLQADTQVDSFVISIAQEERIDQFHTIGLKWIGSVR